MSRLAVLVAAALIATAACHRAPRVRPATDGSPPPVMLTTLGRIPRDAARFEIESVDDSTARFRAFEAKWVRPGMQVYAVDPARRDALVARLRITGADSGRMIALVTAQVTRLTTDHFLLAVKPSVPWYRTRRFWWGVVSGSVVGATAATIAK